MKAWLILGANLALLSAPALAEATRYEVVSFGPAIAGAERLHATDNGRADLGDDVSYTETSTAGLARLPQPEGATRMVYALIGARRSTHRDARAEARRLGGAGPVRSYYLFAQLSAGSGREDDFNGFYDRTHLPDVLNVPGMVWGLRARLQSATPGAKAPGYLALYRFRSADLRRTINEVNRRLKDGTTRPFPAGAVTAPAFSFYAAPVR